MRSALKATVLALALALPAAAVAQEVSTADQDLIKAKCSFCHPAHRFTMIPEEKAKIAETIKRMIAKNPDWFSNTTSDHLVEVVSNMLKDKTVVSERQAWMRAVADGKTFFSDTTIGTNGKSCASCHTEAALKGVADDFPKYDAKRQRYYSFLEWVNRMIVENMGGKELAIGDPRSIAIESYIKSLR